MKKIHIEAAIKRRPHPLEYTTGAMAAMHTEMEEKVKNGYAKIHNYGDIKGKSRNLNISPVAMIPHKFRAFRNILDLSL